MAYSVIAVLIFYGLSLFNAKVAEAKKVDSFDPGTLYKYFKAQAGTTDTAYAAEADGIAYFTPNTHKLINDGKITKDEIIEAFNMFDSGDKTNMDNFQKKMAACWNDEKKDAESYEGTPAYCNFQDNFNFKCDNYHDKKIAKKETLLKLMNCLAQNDDGIKNTLSNIDKRKKRSWHSHFSRDWGMHVELGGGVALGFYAQGSTGWAMDMSNRGNCMSTYTYCLGWKFDFSAGFSVSVSFLKKYADVTGEALTIELGFDLVGEAGFDALFHFSVKDGRVNGFIGYGFSLGMGVGIAPIDIALSYCNTQYLDKYENSVMIATTHKSGWTCDETYLGVVSESSYWGDFICCPESNPDHTSCDTGFCWFKGRKCPKTPQVMARDLGKDGLRFVVTHSNCPGQTYIPEGHHNRNKCLDMWKVDPRQAYVYYRYDTGDCWFSETKSIDTCVWAPSPKKGYSEFYNSDRNTG